MSDLLHLAEPLPIGSAGKRATGWSGIWTLILTEAALFGYLLVAYFYLYIQSGQQWPPEILPPLGLPGISTLMLVSSSLFVWLGERAVKKRAIRPALFMQSVGILLGSAFVALQGYEWMEKVYDPVTHLYGSLYFTITGFHLLHVGIGLIILLLLTHWTARNYFSPERHAALAVGGLYWHFVDAVWIFIFFTFDLLPYLVNPS